MMSGHGQETQGRRGRSLRRRRRRRCLNPKRSGEMRRTGPLDAHDTRPLAGRTHSAATGTGLLLETGGN